MMSLFDIKNLNLYYGDFHALKDINLELPKNEISAFIGPSGCGKSTLLKTLNRMNDLVEGCKITGQVELDGVDMKVTGTVPAGRVFVDGYGVGDVGSIVLRDRKHLAQDGLIIVVVTMESTSGAVVAGPDIVSRGFVYVRESEELMDNARQRIVEVLDDCASRSVREWGTIKTAIKDDLSNFIYKKTKRAPMILPIIMEI